MLISGANTNITDKEITPAILQYKSRYKNGKNFVVVTETPYIIVDKTKQRSLVFAWYPPEKILIGRKNIRYDQKFIISPQSKLIIKNTITKLPFSKITSSP